jgi:hypothetical protein
MNRDALFYLRLTIGDRVNVINNAILIQQLVDGDMPMTVEESASADLNRQQMTKEYMLAKNAQCVVDELIAGTFGAKSA